MYYSRPTDALTANGMIVFPKADKPQFFTAAYADQALRKAINRPVGPMTAHAVATGDAGVLTIVHAPGFAHAPNPRATWMLHRLDGTRRTAGDTLAGPVAFLVLAHDLHSQVQLGWAPARAFLAAEDALAADPAAYPADTSNAFTRPAPDCQVRVFGNVLPAMYGTTGGEGRSGEVA
jgi:hypothetical protein